MQNLLKEALQSHKLALELDQENADVIFNTAQVLTSLAEEISNSKHPSDSEISQSINFIQEALELFQRCFLLQEFRYTESEEQRQATHVQQQNDTVDTDQFISQEDGEEQEQWTMIIEPVTKTTLIETAIAQLETLTTLCNLLSYHPETNGITWIEEYSTNKLHSQISAYLSNSEREYEASLAYAGFLSALNDVLFRSDRIDFVTYYEAIVQGFNSLDPGNDQDGLCSKADSFISFNTTVAEKSITTTEQLQVQLQLRWKSLSTALDALTKASKLSTSTSTPSISTIPTSTNPSNLPKIHISRGDTEMSRWRLSLPPWEYQISKQNATILIRNAQTYYRGAAALARRNNDVEDERDGICKEAIAAALDGEKGKFDSLKINDSKGLVGVAEDMVDDGLVDFENMKGLFE